MEALDLGELLLSLFLEMQMNLNTKMRKTIIIPPKMDASEITKASRLMAMPTKHTFSDSERV